MNCPTDGIFVGDVFPWMVSLLASFHIDGAFVGELFLRMVSLLVMFCHGWYLCLYFSYG